MKNQSSIWAYLKREILAGVLNPVIIEIGVHWAESTRIIMRYCEGKPEYYGFEPDPRNLHRIGQQKLQYPFTLIESAVSNTDGEVSFYLSDGNHPRSGNPMTGANSIRKPKAVLKEYEWINFDEEMVVQSCKLDTYFKDKMPNRIDFIWADMQGAEYDMILGAKEVLSRTRYIYLEYSEEELYEGQKTLEEYMQLLNSFGNWNILHKYSIDVLIKNMGV